MTNLFLTIFHVSVSLSLVILIIKLLSPFLNRHYQPKLKYWTWLIIAIQLLLPFRIINPLQAAVITVTDMPITFLQIISWVWLIGCALFLAYQLIGYYYAKRQIYRWSTPVENKIILNQLSALAGDMGIKTRIALLTSEKVAGPMMTGFFRPLMLLPHESYSPNDLTFILRHELTHYKRKDLLYKLFLLLIRSVHWYNPVIHLMAREANADLEISCDKQVTQSYDFEQRKAYGEAIINAIQFHLSRGHLLSTYFFSNQNQMKARFYNIMENKKRKFGVGVLAFVAILALGSVSMCCFLVGV